MVHIQAYEGIRPGQAYAIATQYREQNGFIKERIWVFESDEHDLSGLRVLIRDFFSLAVGTDLYVLEVPADSLFYEQEKERLYGTTGTLCGSGTK